LASELIASIDVIKGSTADLTEGGVGGTVRITTRKPLDFTKRTIAASLSGEQGSLRGGVQPRRRALRTASTTIEPESRQDEMAWPTSSCPVRAT
jgi:outer membrane receptor protein involved in Fe transport